jgi:aryl-alcohol dehydrogenase-like predicted oxidoreductase
LLGAPLDAVAFAAALANPWVDVVLSGAVTEAQLLTNLRSPDMAITLDRDALPLVAQSPEEYWAARTKLPWA